MWTELGVAWSETGAYLDLTWTLPGPYLDLPWSRHPPEKKQKNKKNLPDVKFYGIGVRPGMEFRHSGGLRGGPSQRGGLRITTITRCVGGLREATTTRCIDG